MDFILDPSLVLYLPLWELDGASFMSRDYYGHLATVTGALWTPQGRTFDGDDDYVTVPHNAVFNFGTGALSWIVWFKANAPSGVQRILSKGDSDGFVTRTQNNSIQTYVGAGGGGDGDLNFAFADTIAFHQLAIIRNNGVVKAYLDLLEKASANSVGSVNVATDLTIGIRHNLGEDFSGKIGEVEAYNRGITFPELQNFYLATEWRYR